MTLNKLVRGAALCLLIGPFPMLAHSNEAKKILNEISARNLLLQKIETDSLYTEWTSSDCIIVVTEETSRKFFDFAIHEDHNPRCGGDPDTSAVVDRFRVYRTSKLIQWYNFNGEFVPYKYVLKFRKNGKKLPNTSIKQGT